MHTDAVCTHRTFFTAKIYCVKFSHAAHLSNLPTPAVVKPQGLDCSTFGLPCGGGHQVEEAAADVPQVEQNDDKLKNAQNRQESIKVVLHVCESVEHTQSNQQALASNFLREHYGYGGLHLALELSEVHNVNASGPWVAGMCACVSTTLALATAAFVHIPYVQDVRQLSPH
jgi:hypothetical protein